MIMARVYMSIATMKNKTHLARELQNQLKESQHALGDATADADLNHRSVGAYYWKDEFWLLIYGQTSEMLLS